MKRMKRACTALLALLTLAGCGYQRTEPLPYPEPAASEPDKAIAYVPLDDRPDNVDRVVYLAESMGYALKMPDRDLYRTALDSQPLNENGTRHGDPWGLYQWVLEQEAAGCDRYILFLDQLHSGGLVNSRSATEYDTPLPDGGTRDLSQMLEDLLTALAADENNVVWLLDSVMRLAPTLGNIGGSQTNYNWIRAFGAQPRETLEGDALTIEAVWDSYWWGNGKEDLYGKTLEQQGEADPDLYEVLSVNLQSRKRKLLFSDGVQQLLAQPGFERFRLLIGIDDSSLEDCIQKNEIAYFRRGLRTDAEGKRLDWILSGVDDLAFKAVTRLYLDEIGWTGAEVSVLYTGGTEGRPACEYDFQPLTKVMSDHLEFFDLTEIPRNSGEDFSIQVLTQPQDPECASGYWKQVCTNIGANRKNSLPTILIDAGNGQYGRDFQKGLIEEAELGWLLAYSGMLDMAIVTGTALSHGAARYAVLKNGENADYMDRAWARTLADSVIKDFCYRTTVRNDLVAYVRNDLGGDPDNFWSPPVDREALLERLEISMEKSTAAVIKNLEKSHFISSFNLSQQGVHEEKHWGGIALENYRFPWDRAFEIGMNIRLGEFTEVS